MLSTGEMFPSQRVLSEEEGKSVPGEAQMEGLEHLGQYVYEMTNAKVQQLRAEQGLSAAELVAAPLQIEGGDAMDVIPEEMEYEHGEGGFEEEDEEEEEGGESKDIAENP